MYDVSRYDQWMRSKLCDDCIALKVESRCVDRIDRTGVIHKVRPLSVDELFWQHLATINLLRQDFLTPEFGTKFQREISILIFGVTRISLRRKVG